MLAILEDTRTGEITSCEVPAPELLEGGILVQTHFSAISSGTERATIETGKKSMLAKAMARPELVRQVLDFAQKNGVRAAYRKVQARLETQRTMGYSCAGVVLATAAVVHEFRPGDRVACAGVGYANHAEINFVPRNLAVRVPEPVSLKAASLTTIGAIAMQGVRQARVSCGESVVVVGAGLIGLMAIKIARAAGCRVIAADIDKHRTDLALKHGAHLSVVSADPNAAQIVKEFTRYGADAALITAGSKSSEPTEFGARLLRDRGRVVVVGDVDLGVSRGTMYMKELSLYLSRSYGPGRYDSSYEEGGSDYPVGYVRWTEQRNMEAFLDLLAGGSINVDPLVENVHPVEQGAQAYGDIRRGHGYTSILQYPVREQKTSPAVFSMAAPRSEGMLRVGCIGAGGFARDVIFPSLRASSSVIMSSIATASGASSESARRGFGFELAQTPKELIADSRTDAVFVLSRHDSHASYVSAAIDADKPVLVEKPLALDREQLAQVRAAYQRAEPRCPPFVMVGFNRRFAPFTERIREFFGQRQEPLMVQARINAGYLPPSHWTQGPAGGGRILGEFCHFVDWARFLVGRPIVSVWAAALADGARYHRDNLVASIRFNDGSLANLVYLANGDASVAKEFYEVFCEGAVARLDDFVNLELARNHKKKILKSARDKGHKAEIARTVSAMRQRLPAPISFAELVEVTEATFAVHESLSTGLPVSIRSLESQTPVAIDEVSRLVEAGVEAS